jgi:predicted DNA-binding transcriptional regulator AlpA
MNRILSQKEAAKILRKSLSTLYRWREQGIGPVWSKDATNHVYYLDIDLQEWILSRRRHRG